MAQNLNTRKKDERKRVLLIGDSGGGKTSLIGTAPEPIYIADFDNGLAPLVGKDITYDEFFPNDEKPAEAWNEFMKVLNQWRKEPQGATFAFDSLTMGANAALRAIASKNGREVGKLQIGDWGQAINDVQKALAYVSTLRCHVIVTAHYQMARDETMGGIYFVPLLYGKDLPMLVPAYFNDVWRPYVDTDMKSGKPSVAYKLQIAPAQKYTTLKNTLGLGPDVIVVDNPNFSDLITKGK